MGEMHEIVDAVVFGRLLLLAAIVTPVAGALIGATIGWRSKTSRSGAIRGFSIGLSGPLVLGLWHLFNAITDRLGLDTVRNFFVNIGLFSLIGILLGFGLRWAEKRSTFPR